MMSQNEIKQQASILKEFLTKNRISIKLSSCYQAISKMHGFPDWNTMSAVIKKNQTAYKSSFIDSGLPIQISNTAILIMANHGSDGKFSEDAYRLLTVILNKVNDNSLTVTGISHRSLWEKWTKERFNLALDKLLSNRFIHHTYDKENKLVITINPLFFWKGDKEAHIEAVKLFNFANACSNGIISDVDLLVADIKLKSDELSIASVIAFVETRDKNKVYSKTSPILELGESTSLEAS